MRRCPRCKVLTFPDDLPSEHSIAMCTMRVRAQLDKALRRYQHLADRYRDLTTRYAEAAMVDMGPRV